MTERYPLLVDLAGRRVLVVGGGPVASRKVCGLLAAGADITVIAPDVVPAIAESAAGGHLSWAARRAVADDVVAGAWRLVVTATDDVALNGELAAAADAAGALVNDATAVDGGPAAVPAVHRDGPVTVAVATGGTSPGAAVWLRDLLADAVPAEVVAALEVVEDLRPSWPGGRRPAWSAVLQSGMLDAVRAGNTAEAKERLQTCLS